MTFFAAKDWLVDRRKAIGRTALCLSGGGSLAMHHMGVCRFLLEDLCLLKKNHSIHGTGIFTCIYHRNKANVGKYAIHGWYGLGMDGRKNGFRKGGLSNILGV